MKQMLIISGLMASLLAGCGDKSAVKGQQVRQTLAPSNGYAEFVDTRLFVPAVSNISISPTTSGAIITATGLVPSLGYFDAQLVPTTQRGAADMVLEFRIRAPKSNPGTGTAKQREVTVARSISAAELATLRTVTVQTASGSRTIRR
jgi:hypothetical protein